MKIVHQAGGQLPESSILCNIPWRHQVAILSKCNTCEEANFYMEQTIQNNWSRNILEIQLETKLIERRGKASNNFELTLPKPMSDLARETLKDPYTFDFLTLESNVQEIELEKQLIENITKFSFLEQKTFNGSTYLHALDNLKFFLTLGFQGMHFP